MCTVTFVAQSERRLGKGFIYAADGDSPVFRNGDEPGKWKTLKEIGERDVTISKHVRIFRFDTPDHATRLDLREKLSRETHGMLLLGVPRPETPLEQPTRRTLQTMMDAPRAWLSIDIDGLSLGEHFDSHEQDGELADKLFEILEERGLEWLIADCIIHLSSSHGMFDRNTMRAHVDWLLKEPLTLAQQKALVEKMNACKFGRIADPSIYHGAGVMFTAPAYTFRRIFVPGVGFRDEELPHPVRVQRVRLVKRGLTHVEIPKDVLATLDVKERVARVRQVVGGGKVRAPGGANKIVITEGAATNLYATIRDTIHRMAMNCPVEYRDATRDALHAALIEQIMGLPDAADEKATQIRLSYLAEAEFNRLWNGSIEKANAIPVAPAPAPTTPDNRITVDVMREALMVSVTQVKAESIALYEGTAEPPQPGPDDPPPMLGEIPKPEVPHLLIRVPPGAGKTTATLKTITPYDLTTYRINYFTPRIGLSQEVVETMRSLLPGPELECHRSLVRMHYGREYLCTQKDTYGKLCKVYEDIGRSPLKPVCTTCSDFETCAWPKQREDTNPGLVVMQHAYITSSIARLKEDSHGRPAFAIVDESPLSTLMDAAKTTRTLRHLKRTARVAKRGRMDVFETADLMAYRAHLINVVEEFHPLPADGQAHGLLRPVGHHQGTAR